VPTPGGPVRALLPPATLGGVPPRMDAVPAVGEHTDAILAALGRSAAEIADLHAAGVV
jgi:formyl-CoA transferase